jgi:catechol 2,3-dioxygenase-like lactoylglutathione lyase family enzyme
MISGAHVIVYSKNAEADRTFFRDVLGFKYVDAGHGWLIFRPAAGRSRSPPVR